MCLYVTILSFPLPMTTMWMALGVKQMNIHAQSFPGSGEALLPKTYLTCPILSPDGLTLLHTIYFA